MTSDILADVDAATQELCACGCGLPLHPDGPSAYFVDAEHQQAYHLRQTTNPHEVRGTAYVDSDHMRWRPDLVTAADDTNLEPRPDLTPTYEGRYRPSCFNRLDRIAWHLRLDDGHRYVGTDIDLTGSNKEMAARIVEAWDRLEREMGNTRHLIPDGRPGLPDRLAVRHPLAFHGGGPLDHLVNYALADDTVRIRLFTGTEMQALGDAILNETSMWASGGYVPGSVGHSDAQTFDAAGITWTTVAGSFAGLAAPAEPDRDCPRCGNATADDTGQLPTHNTAPDLGAPPCRASNRRLADVRTAVGVERMLDQIGPTRDGPVAARVELGTEALYELLRSDAIADRRPPLSHLPAGSTATLFGLPLAESSTLPPDAWRIVDTFGGTIRSGTVGAGLADRRQITMRQGRFEPAEPGAYFFGLPAVDYNLAGQIARVYGLPSALLGIPTPDASLDIGNRETFRRLNPDARETMALRDMLCWRAARPPRLHHSRPSPLAVDGRAYRQRLKARRRRTR